MQKVIKTQFPYIDHVDKVANIVIEASQEKEFTIVLSKKETQLFLCVINHGKKTLLQLKEKYIELSHGISAIRLQDLMNGDTELNFKLEDDSECEYFVIGRWIGGQND